MGLWSNTAAAASRPKNYSEDGNASGNNGALKDIVTNAGGWALAPGLAASGNDNTDASPEILIAISGLQGGVIGGSVVHMLALKHLILLLTLKSQLILYLLLERQIRLLQTKHTFYCLVSVQLIWSKTTQLLLNTSLVLEPTH